LELIAQSPSPERDQSRLLVLRRLERRVSHRQFRDLIEHLAPGDVLVLNDSQVIPARLRGRKVNGGGEVEILLVEENAINDWWVMLRPGKRVRDGTRIVLLSRGGQPTEVGAMVITKNAEGHCRLQFSETPNVANHLDSLGEVPLPPYIVREPGSESPHDRDRYQTVFARESGSVAAPTAGLHFTEKVLDEVRARGVEVCFVTLHVGLGTFASLKADRVEDHVLHEERFRLPEATANTITAAKLQNHRVFAVGTTTLRVLEGVAADHGGRLVPASGRTGIFIHPPFEFRIADALLTNFHLPRSTLLMLVCAFASPRDSQGRELILSAYAEAIRERYRFYSYGDAMLIT
jgi:S-adenosylmethionine:tRNA ribosyltransferase-isomerase